MMVEVIDLIRAFFDLYLLQVSVLRSQVEMYRALYCLIHRSFSQTQRINASGNRVTSSLSYCVPLRLLVNKHNLFS